MKKEENLNQISFTIAVVLASLIVLLATAPIAYAGGDDDDGNKQKAEDESAAALADCDENEVERAGFDCIAVAVADIDIEPETETATLTVCKEGLAGNLFSVTGNNPSPSQFELASGQCIDVTIGPGMYQIDAPIGVGLTPTPIITGDCVVDPNDLDDAIGEIQSGETQICEFTYLP